MVIIKRNKAFNPFGIPGTISDNIFFNNEGCEENNRARYFPVTNIYQEDDSWTLTFEVPGVDPSHLELRLQGNVLTLKGKRSVYSQDEETKVHRREGCVKGCEFARSVKLPQNADLDRIHANLDNGMMVVTFDKSKESQGKKIEIASSAEAEADAEAES